MIDKVKQLIMLLEKKVFQHKLQFQFNFHLKLINGRFLMLIWKKFNQNKKIKKELLTKRFNNLDCIQLVLKSNWKLWKEWLYKMIKKSNITIINIIGATEKH